MENDPEKMAGILTGYKTIEYLQDEECVLYFDGPNGDHPEDNIRIYGSPWQPEFYNWAFNLPRNGEALKAKWDAIPENTDILITHGSNKKIKKFINYRNYANFYEKLWKIYNWYLKNKIYNL
jgi:hypothetical protein